MTKALMIAAPMSGSGKTTVARGLMAAYTARGLRVQPFKCGPDYIDTKFHETVCGWPSVNLDTFMATPEHVRSLFSRYAANADVCIVEGMMGLFDGYDRDLGSSAEIASTLNIPVVLVVDARSAAYSTAALLQGFTHFRNDVHIAGIIFNKVGSARHYEMLRQVCDDLHLTCFGYLPKEAALEQASRYLGLDFSQAAAVCTEAGSPWFEDIANRLLDHLTVVDQKAPAPERILPCHALVARNAEAFSFIYQETLDSFASVHFFDPETEVPDFSGIDLLYLPGGYPERHLEALVRAEATRQAIKDYAEQGGRIVAECGGMMYLCQQIVDDNRAYPMCGVLPYAITARHADRKLSLGYRSFVLDGHEYRGHEFHYTQFLASDHGAALPYPTSATQVYNAKGEAVATPVMKYKNVLASYIHLYSF